jgi:hypothetical protein
VLRDDIKGLLKATSRDFRKFGLMVGGVLCLLGLWFCLRHKPFYGYVLVSGVALLILGVILPRSLRWIYVSWTTLATLLGAVVSSIILTLLFYVVVTPVGLFARAVGKDFLSQKLDRKAPSYWILRDVSKPKEKYEHEQQF